MAPTTGTLYVHIEADPNPGEITLQVQKHSGEVLGQATLSSGDVYDHQFTGLPLGPQEWYVVVLSWPRGDFHNIAADGITKIACGYPATANNEVKAWQASGSGVVAQIPALMNLPQAG